MTLDKLKTLLLPKEEIVGIEITDTYIKVLGVDRDTSKTWVGALARNNSPTKSPSAGS